MVKVLLTESQINAGAVNLRGQNPLHVLANYPKDNAAAIAEVFLEAMPEYDLNRVDVEGNSGEYRWGGYLAEWKLVLSMVIGLF